jgi:GNAT superfamily N-acetyltransferase
MLSDAFLDGEILANRRALWTERLVPLPTMSFGFIANLERLSVGFCFGFGAADAKWGTMLDNIHVLPEYKSRGIGRLLLAKFASEAATRDANAGLFLWAYEDNTATRKFYERLGASPVERAVDEAPGGGRIAECKSNGWLPTGQSGKIQAPTWPRCPLQCVVSLCFRLSRLSPSLQLLSHRSTHRLTNRPTDKKSSPFEPGGSSTSPTAEC